MDTPKAQGPAAANAAVEPQFRAEERRWWRSKAFRRFLRNPLAITGVVLLVFFVLTAVFAPLITATQIAERYRGHTCARDLGLPRDQGEALAALRNPATGSFWRALVAPPMSCLRVPRIGFSTIPEPPSSEHVMGVASEGYDIFYGVVWGTRMAFYVGVLVSSISLALGILIGGAAGFFGGWLDNLLMRFTDTVYAFPNLILAVVFVTIFGPSLTNALVALAVVGWTTYARIFRGDILRVRNLDFVDGARALGATNGRVFGRHVLPNAIGSLVIVASLDIGAVVLVASTLAFLGLGAERGTADWGQMVAFSRSFVAAGWQYWYTWVWPGIAIVLFVLGWNLLGDAYRDVFDPHS